MHGTVSREVPDRIRELTDGRGTDSVIDAVGMEARGSPVGEFAQKIASALPRSVPAPMTEEAGVDRLSVLYRCIDSVWRAGTLSLSGVSGGIADPLPMQTLFDKGVTVRMGQGSREAVDR